MIKCILRSYVLTEGKQLAVHSSSCTQKQKLFLKLPESCLCKGLRTKDLGGMSHPDTAWSGDILTSVGSEDMDSQLLPSCVILRNLHKHLPLERRYDLFC